jgi:hypothetical protein
MIEKCRHNGALKFADCVNSSAARKVYPSSRVASLLAWYYASLWDMNGAIIPWRSIADTASRDIQCAEFFPRECGRAEISRRPLFLTRVAFRTSRVASTWSDANDGKLSSEKNASAHRAPDVHGPPCGVTYSLSVPARP